MSLAACLSVMYTDPRPYIKIAGANNKIECFLDSGSVIRLIDLATYHSLGSPSLVKEDSEFTSASGDNFGVLGSILVAIVISRGETRKVRFYVARSIKGNILGAGGIRDFSILIQGQGWCSKDDLAAVLPN